MFRQLDIMLDDSGFLYILRNAKWLLLLLFFINVLGCAAPKGPKPILEYDLIIKNGTIVDGSGGASYTADIYIHQDTIAYIGKADLNETTAKLIIDAEGKHVAPGFIDAHAHGDPLETPQFENFLAMGVTSICLGQDGFSPVGPVTDWMQKVNQKSLGTNIAMFIGHGTLRNEAGIGFDTNPTDEKLSLQQNLLRTAFNDGVFGMSTGLEYSPGTFAVDTELIPLAKIVGERGGLIMSHIRNEDDDQIEASIKELVRQGEYCNVQVSHMKSVYGKGRERGKELLKLLDNKSDSKYSIHADVYPYTASYTGIGIVFPKWAKAPNDYAKVVSERKDELLSFLKQKIIDRNGPEATLFGTAPYAGMTLAQVSTEQNLPYEKVLLGIGPNKMSGAYFIMDDELQEEIIAHPKVMVCSDGSPGMRHPRSYGTFAKIIEEFVIQRKRLSLEEAVRKMTALPAQNIGLHKRGLLKSGYYADLIIFDPLQVKAIANYEAPHQLAKGMDIVIVNGKLAWKEDSYIEGAGRLLKKAL